MTRCRAIVAALVLLAPTLCCSAARAADPDGMKLGEFIPAASPQPAPEISFADANGKTAALADFKGRFILLNLWATWCQPCIREIPALEELQAKLGPTLTVIAVSEDRKGLDAVGPYIAYLGFDKVQIYLDPQNAAGRAFAARGLPTSFLIDDKGRVLGKVEGAADWTSPELLATLTRLLPEPPAPGEVKPPER